MSELKQNPYQGERGEWYWRDDADHVYGPYASQRHAVRDLLNYMDDHAPEAKAPSLGFIIQMCTIGVLTFTLMMALIARYGFGA